MVPVIFIFFFLLPFFPQFNCLFQIWSVAKKNRVKLTLIRVACQPLPKEGLVVFKTPTSTGRGWG